MNIFVILAHNEYKSQYKNTVQSADCKKDTKMTVILIRTVIFYLILMLVMRLMGKRQIGEIQLPEFVSAVMLSEIAALPITDRDIPLFHGIVSLLILGGLEVVTAFLCRKLPKLRRVLYGEPIILMAKGRFSEKNMDKARISIDELLSAIRAQGYKQLNYVYYVILEQTGKISILPTADASPLTPKDTGARVCETGLDMPVYSDGVKFKSFAKEANVTDGDIEGVLRKTKTKPNECLIISFDCNGKVKLVKKEKTQ